MIWLIAIPHRKLPIFVYTEYNLQNDISSVKLIGRGGHFQSISTLDLNEFLNLHSNLRALLCCLEKIHWKSVFYSRFWRKMNRLCQVPINHTKLSYLRNVSIFLVWHVAVHLSRWDSYVSLRIRSARNEPHRWTQFFHKTADFHEASKNHSTKIGHCIWSFNKSWIL